MSTMRFNSPPGWPQPPQGWSPDPNWRPDPSWPPAPQGWQWWVADEPAPYGGFPPPVPVTQEAWPGARPATWAPPQVTAWPTQPLAKAPRSNATRVWLTVAILVMPFVVAFFAGGIAGALIGVRAYLTVAEREQAVSTATGLITWLWVICLLVAYTFAARKVSYRWFDTFFLLVPIYSIFWMIKIAYRLAFLPNKDWAPRPDEVRPPVAPTSGWPTY
jgi:hypothetical protein